MFEPGGKATDWHISESVESVEIDIEILFQLPFVVCFKFCLVRREKVSAGIVNQVERKAIYATVTERVQKLKGPDTGIEDAVAPLSVDIVEPVTRHRSDNFHAVRYEKVAQPLITWFKEDREVTAVDDRFHLRHFSELADKITEIRHHLRRASSQVHSFNVGIRQPSEDPINGVPGNSLPAFRACVDVTMDTGEVAKFAQVKLQDLCAFASATQVMVGQRLRKKRTAQTLKFRLGKHL